MDHAEHTDERPAGGKGKRLLRILACICVSAVLWLFTTLSGQFESAVSVSLQYDLPSNLTTTRKLPGEATLLVRTTGWQLIREEFRERALQIDISYANGHEAFITNQRKELFIADMPSDIEVVKIAPDTIWLHLEPRITKRVPVVLSMTEPELPLFIDSISISPDTIELTGPGSILRTIQQWSTELVFTRLDSAVTGIAPLLESRYPEIQLSAVACRYYLSEAEALQGTDSGFVNCAETGARIPVTMTYFARSAAAYRLTDFGITCDHGEAHSLIWHNLPEDILHVDLSYTKHDTQNSEHP